MKTLAAIVRTSKAPFSLTDIELPELGAHDVLVQIAGVGICHTDLASRDGNLGAPFPSVFGHEGAGVVTAVGRDVTKLVVGDHVVLAPDSDGSCPLCQSGSPMYCDRFTDLNLQTDPHGPTARLHTGEHAHIKYFGQSSFAHFALAGDRNAVKVPKDAPLSLLGPLGCGIQTGAGTVMNGLRPRAGASILVLGTGTVGMAAIMGAAVCGCAKIIAVDRVESRLELSRTLGATHTIDTNHSPDLVAAILEIVPRGVDYIVDSAGVPALVEASIGGLARLGTVALVAVPPTPERTLNLPWLYMLLKGQIVQGFIEGNAIPDVFIPQMIALHQAGRFPFDKLIRVYPFEQINEAIEDQHAGKTIKAVLEMRS
ncbi:NAD(P)-dependent alcohol dehydrogenase [Paucibacter sp. R3-3]|uniref:NAD(P)-dependent alcohol dehydrogenase n=1 Tax=Roseateles agri TaxID=3098619 RepID=A0ABU5DRR5_9BURK|nr:NAD(P)-dependent alcohol dehydrogenase [Paucibacter sp. R3-3]MDY0749014.1 NAD(P)-dependent alcohol dehydrogenase [Paucibacter sp. R3-3]